MRYLWNIIKYAVVFLCNLLMLLFVHSYFNFILMILMLVFPVVSMVCAILTKRRLTVFFDGATGRLSVDEPFLMAVILENKSIFPSMNVTMELRLSNELFSVSDVHTLCVPAYGGRSDVIDYQLSCRYVGVWKASVKELYLTDWLGFFRMKKVCDADMDYVVYPKGQISMEPERAALSQGMSELEETGRKGHDFSDVSDVREYIPGDRLQSIHWKLTAKQNALMVKDRVSMSSSQLIILVELVEDASHILNEILCATYGIAEFLLSEQVPFSLYSWSEMKQDMARKTVDTHDDIDAWLEQIFYERAYADGTLGFHMMSRLLDAERKLLVIGRSGDHQGTTAFTYGTQVEGTICG